MMASSNLNNKSFQIGGKQIQMPAGVKLPVSLNLENAKNQVTSFTQTKMTSLKQELQEKSKDF